LSARDAEAIETFASRATVVIVGVPSWDSPCIGSGSATSPSVKDYRKRLQDGDDAIRCPPTSS
jgi:hypothetical protein